MVLNPRSYHETRSCLAIVATSHLGPAKSFWHLEASPHDLLGKCFVWGETSLRANSWNTLPTLTVTSDKGKSILNQNAK